MFRLRCAVATVCLAVVLFAALPGAAMTQREAEHVSASAPSDSMGNRLVDAALEWGRATLSWLQALIAAEHGGVVPISPPPPAEP